MTALLELVDRGIALACRAMLYFTLSIVFFILSVNVGLRYAAGSSLAWASELPELMFPWMIMAGVVLAAQHSSHIAVVLVTQKLGPWRRPVLQAGSLVVAALYGGLAVVAWPLMQIAADEKSPILQVPGSISVASLIIGFAMLAVVTLCRFASVGLDEVHEPGEGEAA